MAESYICIWEVVWRVESLRGREISKDSIIGRFARGTL